MPIPDGAFPIAGPVISTVGAIAPTEAMYAADATRLIDGTWRPIVRTGTPGAYVYAWADAPAEAADLDAIRAGAGIDIDRSVPGRITISASAGGTPPSGSLTVRLGTSPDVVPEAGELSIVAITGVGTVLAYQGSRRLLIGRLASEGAISGVLFSDDQSRTNQIGAFMDYADTVEIEARDWSVWVSNQALTQSADLTVTVS